MTVDLPVATRLDPVVVSIAKEEAVRILKTLCATVEWGSGGLLLRILPEPLTTDSSAEAMGMAMPAFGRGAVFVSRIHTKAQEFSGNVRLPTLLGCVIAHEIGHLLLGPTHSRDGIMQADFGRREILLAERRILAFHVSDRMRLP